MSGWAAFQSPTTLSSTVFCSGASPPPRQQYQRISTFSPGAVLVVVLGAVLAATLGSVLAVVPPLGACEAFDPPHAVASSASAVTRTPVRERRGAMKLLLLGPTIGTGGQPLAAAVAAGAVAAGGDWVVGASGSVCQLSRSTTRS